MERCCGGYRRLLRVGKKGRVGHHDVRRGRSQHCIRGHTSAMEVRSRSHVRRPYGCQVNINKVHVESRVASGVRYGRCKGDTSCGELRASQNVLVREGCHGLLRVTSRGFSYCCKSVLTCCSCRSRSSSRAIKPKPCDGGCRHWRYRDASRS